MKCSNTKIIAAKMMLWLGTVGTIGISNLGAQEKAAQAKDGSGAQAGTSGKAGGIERTAVKAEKPPRPDTAVKKSSKKKGGKKKADQSGGQAGSSGKK